jgi:hypothetical protein
VFVIIAVGKAKKKNYFQYLWRAIQKPANANTGVKNA